MGKLIRLHALSGLFLLSACQTQQEYDAQQKAEEQRGAYRSCLYDATGPFGSASIEVVRDCRRQAYGSSK